ncbi:MAG: hypothetical protein ACI81S_001640, partial [Sphingobacteriales bacterium]
MTKNTTPLDLLRYLYHETSTVQNEQIAGHVAECDKLSDEFDNFVDVKKELDKFKFTP